MSQSPSFGIIVKVDMAGSTAYVQVSNIKDVSGPDLSRGDVDATSHDSADGWREFFPGLADGGTFSFPMGLDPTEGVQVGGAGTGLLGDLDRDGCTMPAWEITLNNCGATIAKWTFDGYVNGFSNAYPLEGINTVDVSVKVTGKPTLTVT